MVLGRRVADAAMVTASTRFAEIAAGKTLTAAAGVRIRGTKTPTADPAMGTAAARDTATTSFAGAGNRYLWGPGVAFNYYGGTITAIVIGLNAARSPQVVHTVGSLQSMYRLVIIDCRL